MRNKYVRKIVRVALLLMAGAGIAASVHAQPEQLPRGGQGSSAVHRPGAAEGQRDRDRFRAPDARRSEPPARPNAIARDGFRPQPPGIPARPRLPALRLDNRYHHNHYYPAPGYRMPLLPGGSLSIAFDGGNFFFHSGVWFRPYAGQFVVIAPPLGVAIPVLPSAYVTLWLGGIPYYYANGVYYTLSPGRGYIVVAPPPGADDIAPPQFVPAPVVPPEPIIYPRAGQTPAQTEADRRDCNRWATTQPSAMADASVFQRAVAACMEGRGYTVR